MTLRMSSIRKKEDIIEIRLADSNFDYYFKGRANINNKKKIAEIIVKIRELYGVDLFKSVKEKDLDNWFKE